jgi:hypothetical protein
LAVVKVTFTLVGLLKGLGLEFQNSGAKELKPTLKWANENKDSENKVII